MRFRPDLLEWMKSVAGPDGVSGVANDAVEAHREAVEAKSKRIIDGVLGNTGKRQPSAAE